jgi:hypothetical protein
LHAHKEDKYLTVEEIHEMIEAGDSAGLADRVSHARAKLAGSKPFWQGAQKDLIAQIRAPDTALMSFLPVVPRGVENLNLGWYASFNTHPKKRGSLASARGLENFCKFG